MATKSEPRTPLKDDDNWVIGYLALHYTKEALLACLKLNISEFHKPYRALAQRCSSCTTANLLDCPTKGYCSEGEVCKVHEKTDPCKRPSQSCPSGLCNDFMSDIREKHVHNPTWKNTDAQKWCEDDFEVAKCFMPAGYSEKTTWEEIDFGGLLAVLTNIKDVKPFDLFRGRSRFSELFNPWLEEVHHDIYQQTHYPRYQMTHRITSLRNVVEALPPRDDNALQALDELLNYSLISIDPFMREFKRDLLQLEEALEEMKTELMVTSCDGFESVLRKRVPHITELLNKEDILKTWHILGSERALRLIYGPLEILLWEYGPLEILLWEYGTYYPLGVCICRSTREKAKSYCFRTYLGTDLQVAFVYEEEPKLRETKSTGLRSVASAQRPQKDLGGELQSPSRSEDIISQETLALQQTQGTELASKAHSKSPQEESTGEIFEGPEVSESGVECAVSLEFFKDLLAELNVEHAIQKIERDSSSRGRMVWWDARVRNVPTGTKQVEFTLTCEKIDHENVIRRPMRRVCNELLRLETKEVTFEDFESESSEFKKLLLLDAVCEAFRKEHDHNIEAFASTSKDGQLVIVALNGEKPWPVIQKYRGFEVIQFAFYEMSEESMRAENCARQNALQNDPDQKKELSRIIEFHTDDLFKSHSNLEIVGASAIKWTKGEYIKKPTITLYCRCKHFIPYGEMPFPKELKHPDNDVEYKTDVREGYFTLCTLDNLHPCDCHHELSMGSSIGLKSGQVSATVGPFVEIQGKTYFLTVRHLFQPLDVPCEKFEKSEICQPAEEDIVVNPYRRPTARQESKVCGEAEKLIFDGLVDVALVQVSQDRIPDRGYFILAKKGALEFAGFSQQSFPEYNHGKVHDARTHTDQERVIKFGKTTGLTMGTLEQNCITFKMRSPTPNGTLHNGRVYTKVFKNQLMINSHNPTQVRRFFNLGDSGSAVFLVDNQNELHCIGIGIGTYLEYCAIVTPITTILDRLSEEMGKRVKMKTFHMEQMKTDDLTEIKTLP